MRKVLMIAYIFPPTAITGVHRTAAFTRYLPEYGWQPVILTTGNSVYAGTDNSMTAGLPSNLDIIRVKTFEPAHARAIARRMLRSVNLATRLNGAVDWRIDALFASRCIPDEHAPWARKAIPAAVEAVRKYRPQAIYTTSWPYSDHMVGREVARSAGIPWIADFRDPWLGSFAYTRDPSTRRGQTEAQLERDFVHQSAAVVCTSKSMIEDFRARYPEIPEARFQLIRNGFEPADIPASSMAESGPLRIGHVGAFYRRRTPETLLSALKQLTREGIGPDRLQLTFVGSMGGTEDLIRQQSLETYCQVLGNQPQTSAYMNVADCAVLWLLNHRSESNTVPGKTYEYLATGKCILASVASGSEVQQLLSDAGPGTLFVEPDDISGTAAALRRLLMLYERGGLPKRDRSYADQFSRGGQTKKLAVLFDSICDGAPLVIGPRSVR